MSLLMLFMGLFYDLCILGLLEVLSLNFFFFDDCLFLLKGGSPLKVFIMSLVFVTLS